MNSKLLRVDLHMHSWVSDGDVSPTEVVRHAEKAKLDVIAVTDHDTAGGVQEALKASEGRSVSIVPGIEISTMHEGRELHILGYWIDPTAPTIVAHQEHAVGRRRRRMEAMVARLCDLGMEVTIEDVDKAAGESVHVLGRPHLARALLALGHTRYFSEAFDRWIGDDGPAYVAEGFPTPPDAIETIHAAGGKAVWAHPPTDWFSEGIDLLAEWGLDGIECYRPGSSSMDVEMFEAAAERLRLLRTGGSDWHGPDRFKLGDFAVAGDRISPILAAGGIGEA